MMRKCYRLTTLPMGIGKVLEGVKILHFSIFFILQTDENLQQSDANFEHNDAESFHQRYFEGSKRSKTSNNTLSVDKDELQRKIEEIASKGGKALNSFKNYFDYWMLLLANNYNLLFHGLGRGSDY